MLKIDLTLTTILFLIFLTLKLTGVIGWSWWYVTAPLWGPTALIIVLGVLVALLVGAFQGYLTITGRKKKSRQD